MSNSAVITGPPATSTRNPSEECVAPSTRSQRGDRSAGKGRRRRAIAEQRRVEQQSWNHFLHEREEEVYVAPPRPPVSRRQLRRASRRSSHEDWEASLLDEDDDNIDIALALSLSLSEPGHGAQAVNLASPFGSRPLDMSYESLVMLENVKCTAPPTLVNSLTGHVFNKEASTECVEELCTICQVEYKDDDLYMLLPCLHTFHDICGSEWFLNHSKLCPVCKHDVTEKV